MRKRIAWAVLALSAWRAAAQSANPVIKVEVPTVSVDVIVTDKKGHHVPGLGAKDFRILDGGAAQEIVSFAAPAGQPEPPSGATEQVEQSKKSHVAPPSGPRAEAAPQIAAPVAVSLPGSLVHFEKQKDQYVAGVTVLLVARDAQGQMVAIHERYSDLRFTKKEREAFESKTFNLQGHMPIPELQPVKVEAIVEFTNGEVGRSEAVPMNAATGTEPRLTNLVLANRVEQADCAADLTDPLCIKNIRVYLPARREFQTSDHLTVYFSALGLIPDQKTKVPALSVTFKLIDGKGEAPLAPDRMMAAPGTAANSLMVLAEFSLKTIAPGKYKLQANAEDTVAHSPATAQATFAVQ